MVIAYAVGRIVREIWGLSKINVSKKREGLVPPRLLHNMPCCLLETEPSQIIFQVSADLQRLPNIVLPFLTQPFDFLVMLLKKCCRVPIVDQTSDHAAYTAVF